MRTHNSESNCEICGGRSHLVEDLENYSTHSIRKTKSSEIFKQTQNVEVCRRLLGHANITATSQYLGLEGSDALEVARNINL